MNMLKNVRILLIITNAVGDTNAFLANQRRPMRRKALSTSKRGKKSRHGLTETDTYKVSGQYHSAALCVYGTF